MRRDESDNRDDSSLSAEDDKISSSEDKTASSTSLIDGNNKADGDADTKLLAKKETRDVLRLRILVLLALLLATLAVSLTVYFITKRAQEEEFNSGFQGNAQKLMDSFNQIVELKIGAITSLAISFTSYARSQNATWPFVTMNDFQQRAASARALSDCLFLELLPLITDETRADWEEYALIEKGWLDEGRDYQEKLDIGISRRQLVGNGSYTGNNVLDFVAGKHNGTSNIANQIFLFDADFVPVVDPGPGPYFPIWESSPILTEPRDLVNYNLLYYPDYAPYINHTYYTEQISIGGIDTAPRGGVTHPLLTTSFFAFITSFTAGELVDYLGDPMSSVYIPVFDSFDDQKKLVGVIVAVINWATYFQDILPPNTKTMTVVLENTCQGPFTYQVQGEQVEYMGQGDLHDPKFSDYVLSTSLNDTVHLKSSAGLAYKLNVDQCVYNLLVYPSSDMYTYYNTNMPLLITFAVVIIFVFTAIMFLVYDRLVERRQQIVLKTAVKSSQIVSSLFPQQIRDRLFAEEYQDGPVHGTKTKLKSFLSGNVDQAETEGGSGYHTKPIADLFTDTTILFADIVGFTAWSSVREPSQVFTLLESLFKAFDELATRRGVFKVETVGDCYVAATGLPDPRKDHAVAMVRFARDCMNRMNSLMKQLEVTLGPDTGDLKMRVGIHSGPVTAGVLRGDRSRFQLFGDTMNTAARTESTGEADRIHLSYETATLLIAAGKESWVIPRDDQVYAKGKGVMQTYWLVHEGRNDADAQSSSGYSSDREKEAKQALSVKPSPANGTVDVSSLYTMPIDRHTRLIEWNVDVLHRLLKQIVARRKCLENAKGSHSASISVPNVASRSDQTVLDEVCEIITLPKFDAKAVRKQVNPDSIVLGDAVVEQLRGYVAGIAALYRHNPFHNFEHASHVTMSVVKLLSRIVAPSDLDFQDGREASSTLHDHTYGITSDPLTQFACIVSALIHDADHPGVPNLQLIKENSSIAKYYKNKSIAEQNSVDLSWELLMDPRFQDLRNTLCGSESSLRRLRQLIVNSVMATDIMDKDLKALRNARWDKAFKENADEGTTTATNRKATIVIEHLIQASDVAHTMQHWHIYRKWNQRLFEEMYKAFKEGRSETDPSDNWYKGEIGFFDFYIIPLAKKLKDCGVFGVSSDEYLTYALKNRQEWETRGQEIVAEMIEKVKEIWTHPSHCGDCDAGFQIEEDLAREVSSLLEI